MEPAEPVPTEVPVNHSDVSSSGSRSSFLSDVQVPQDAVVSDSEWADDWAVEENEHGVVPASTSSASPSPEATHSPGEAEEAHAAAAAPPSLLMSSGEALEADEAPTQPSCSTATQLDPAAIPDGNATRHDTRAADGATASCPPAVQNHPVPAQTPTLPCSSPAEEGRLGAAPMRSPEISAAVEAGPTAQPLSAASQPPTQDQTQPEAPAPSSGGGNVDHAMPAGTGSAWGWGASAWGLQALGGRLQQVAAGTVKELQSSLVELQQALAEVEPSEEGQHKEPEEGDEEVQASPRPLPVAAQLAPAPAAATAHSQDDAAVRETGRQQGDEAEAGEDIGLKAIDEQVEQLSNGAAQALTSLGSLLTGVAKGGWSVGQVLASKVEAATKEMSAGVSGDVQELRQAAKSGLRGAAGSMTMFGMTLEKGFETVSRTAMELLLEDGGQAQATTQRQGSQAGTAAGAAALAALEEDPSSFKGLYALFGGQALRDKLQRLSNECARTCNRSRARLETSQQQQLDALLADLGRSFAPLQVLTPVSDVSEEQGQAQADEGAEGEACWAQLSQRYSPVQHLVAKAMAELLQAAAAPVEDESAQHGAGDVQPQATATGLAGPVKRLAELVAAQVQVLLDVGTSLSAPARGADQGQAPALLGQAASLAWPHAPAAQAALVRRLAQAMISDTAKVSTAMVQAASSSSAAQQQPQQLEGDGSQAAQQLQDSYRDLLYCVLVRSLVSEVAASADA